MIDNTFSALFSSSIIRPLLFSCAIWSAMLDAYWFLVVLHILKNKSSTLVRSTRSRAAARYSSGKRGGNCRCKDTHFFHSDKIFFAFISHFAHYQPFKNIFQTNCICFYTLNFCISHPSFLHFCIIPTLQIPPRIPLYPPLSPFIATHPINPRIRFLPPLYFCLVLQSPPVGAHADTPRGRTNEKYNIKK